MLITLDNTIVKWYLLYHYFPIHKLYNVQCNEHKGRNRRNKTSHVFSVCTVTKCIFDTEREKMSLQMITMAHYNHIHLLPLRNVQEQPQPHCPTQCLYLSPRNLREILGHKKKKKITMQKIRIKNKEKYEKLTETQI